MQRSLAEVVSEFKRNWTRVIEQEQIERVCREVGISWRERILGPVQTVQLLLLQVLHGNTAISHLRMFTAKGFSTSAYCQARGRVPLELFEKLLERMSVGLRRAHTAPEHWLGRRVYLVDGSTFSMPDTAVLRKHFGQPTGQKEGCGFPVAHFVALFHAGTGMIVRVLSGALFSHDLSRFIKLHPALRKEDVVVGDRGFCSFAHLALMARRGVDAVFRIHGAQIVNFRAGRAYTTSKNSKNIPRSRWEKKMGLKDQIVTWFKSSTRRPSWMSENQFRLLPATLQLRELSYNVKARGFRTRRVILVTTLLDPQKFPAQALAELYGERWTIETNFRHLKTTMGMDVLHCHTVEGVLKEFYAFCLVYNLVRTVMLQAGTNQNTSHHKISFIDAVRWLIAACHRCMLLPLLVIHSRPERIEPRAIKRRPKQYDLLSKSRKIWKLETLRA